MTFSISTLLAKRSTKSSAIVFDRRSSRFARAASKIFRSPKMVSGSRTSEPALDLTTQHSVTCPPLPAALVGRACDAWLSLAPGLTRRQRLICTRCRKDVKSVLRCRSCGTLCPTSEIGAAMLSSSAFAFYGLISIVVAIFWFV